MTSPALIAYMTRKDTPTPDALGDEFRCDAPKGTIAYCNNMSTMYIHVKVPSSPSIYAKKHTELGLHFVHKKVLWG